MQTNAPSRQKEAIEQAGRFRPGNAERGHESRGGCVVEKFRGSLGQNGDSKRAERFPVLHKFIEVFLHVGGPGRSQQAAIAEGARTEFRRAVEPSYNFSRREQLNGLFEAMLVIHMKSVARFAVVENLLDLLAGIARSPIEFFDG